MQRGTPSSISRRMRIVTSQILTFQIDIHDSQGVVADSRLITFLTKERKRGVKCEVHRWVDAEGRGQRWVTGS